MRTFSEMCALRGIKLTNHVWSWCGIKDDGTLAIFTLWQDCFVKVGDKEFKVLRVKRGDDGEVWATIIGIERV